MPPRFRASLKTVGTTTVWYCEGRIITVATPTELQALVARASFGTPRRTVLGADYNRVCLLLAVLEKRVGFPLQSQDVFVNVAGGGRVTEPAADLGVVVAAASS